MEFPFGHKNHHHHHHRRDDDGEEEFPPPGRRPPSSYYGQTDPPPPQVSSVCHTSHVVGGPHQYPPPPDTYGRTNYLPPPSMEEGQDDYPPPPMADNYAAASYNRPPPVSDFFEGGPPPPFSSVHHVSHESESGRRHHRVEPHVPSFFHHQTPHQEFIDKPSFRVYTRADPDFSLTIRDGAVVLTRSDPSDPCQHWFKDEKYSIRVKDEEGFPSFALVNKATGQAIKHSTGASHPVQLTLYDPSVLDESVLWTQSKEVSEGYRAIRMVNNICLNMDAWNADKDHGGVRNGTTVVLWEWWKGDNWNQQWKIVPY